MILNKIKTIVLGFGIIILLGLYAVMLFTAAFPYDSEENKRAEYARERAEQRKEAMERMKIEYMLEHH